MNGQIVFDPLLPWTVIAVLAALALAGAGLALWRGLSGWALRFLAGVVLVGALAGAFVLLPTPRVVPGPPHAALVVLGAAHLAGIDRVITIGGAQAVNPDLAAQPQDRQHAQQRARSRRGKGNDHNP